MEEIKLALDPGQILANLILLGIAFLLALPVGWDREVEERNLGLRTFPIVSIAACAFLILGRTLAGDSPEAHARVLEGAITGIGFLGGGAIVKQGASVKGAATAAALWATAGIGAAVAYMKFDVAVILSAAVLATLRFLHPLKRAVASGD